MGYLVIKNNEQKKSYLCTNTCNKPRIKVSNSYIPLTGNVKNGMRCKVSSSNIAEYNSYTYTGNTATSTTTSYYNEQRTSSITVTNTSSSTRANSVNEGLTNIRVSKTYTISILTSNTYMSATGPGGPFMKTTYLTSFNMVKHGDCFGYHEIAAFEKVISKNINETGSAPGSDMQYGPYAGLAYNYYYPDIYVGIGRCGRYTAYYTVISVNGAYKTYSVYEIASLKYATFTSTVRGTYVVQTYTQTYPYATNSTGTKPIVGTLTSSSWG